MTTGGRSLRIARAARQLLHRPPGATPEGIVRHLLAVQAQDARAARLALRARGAGLTAGDVDDALDRRELVVGWLARGTLHLVAAEDYPWLLGLTAPTRLATSRRRLSQEGVGADDARRAVAVVERALGDDGPLTRDELAERIGAKGIRTEGQATPHLLMLAALHGVAVLGPRRDGRPAFVLAADWLGEAPPSALVGRARERALAELARRYLTAHAPASDADLAAWSGLARRDARAGLTAIASELTELGGGRAELAGAPQAPGIEPRLLGPFDPLPAAGRSAPTRYPTQARAQGPPRRRRRARRRRRRRAGRRHLERPRARRAPGDRDRPVLLRSRPPTPRRWRRRPRTSRASRGCSARLRSGRERAQRASARGARRAPGTASRDAASPWSRPVSRNDSSGAW